MEYYCDGCKNDKCYRNKTCIEYIKIKRKNPKYYEKISKYAPDKICSSCEINKPKFCRHIVPKCTNPQMGIKICRNCAYNKRKCLMLGRCEIPEEPYINFCNICFFKAYSLFSYYRHVKSKKHKRKAEAMLKDLTFHESKEFMRTNYLKPIIYKIDPDYKDAEIASMIDMIT